MLRKIILNIKNNIKTFPILFIFSLYRDDLYDSEGIVRPWRLIIGSFIVFHIRLPFKVDCSKVKTRQDLDYGFFISPFAKCYLGIYYGDIITQYKEFTR